MTASTKVSRTTSDTFDANIMDLMNNEPFIIYKGHLDNSGLAQVEDHFMIPAGYALDSVTVLNNSGATSTTVDKIGVGYTKTTGVEGVAAAVANEDIMTDYAIAAPLTFATDRLCYIHTLDGDSATYDIICDYTVVLQKVFYDYV